MRNEPTKSGRVTQPLQSMLTTDRGGNNAEEYTGTTELPSQRIIHNFNVAIQKNIRPQTSRPEGRNSFTSTAGKNYQASQTRYNFVGSLGVTELEKPISIEFESLESVTRYKNRANKTQRSHQMSRSLVKSPNQQAAQRK